MTSPTETDPSQIGRIWKNATWLGLVPVLLNVVALFSTGYIARRVGAEGFGRFSISLAMVGLTQTLTDCGLRALAVRDLSRSGIGTRLALGDLLSLRLLTSSLAMVLAWGIALAMPTGSGLTPVILISSLSVIPTSISGIFIDGLVARDRARATSSATLWSGVLLTIASVVTVVLYPNEVALAASYLLGPVVNLALLANSSREQYGPAPLRWRPRHWKILLRRAFPYFRMNFFGAAIGRVETPLIGWLFGTGMAGIYAAATSLADRLYSVIDSVSTAALPSLMRLGGSPARITDMITKILHPMLGAVLTGAIMAMMGATDAVTVVFGAAYAPGGPALAVALFFLPIIAINNFMFEGFVALRRVDFATSTILVGQVVTAVLMPLLAMILGLPGIPLAKLLGGLSVWAARVSASRDSLVGLWGRQHLVSLARRCAWGLPMPAILWLGNFSPLTAVAISGGAYLVWLAVTAHSSGVLQLLRPSAGEQKLGVVPPP